MVNLFSQQESKERCFYIVLRSVKWGGGLTKLHVHSLAFSYGTIANMSGFVLKKVILRLQSLIFS